MNSRTTKIYHSYFLARVCCNFMRWKPWEFPVAGFKVNLSKGPMSQWPSFNNMPFYVPVPVKWLVVLCVIIIFRIKRLFFFVIYSFFYYLHFIKFRCWEKRDLKTQVFEFFQASRLVGQRLLAILPDTLRYVAWLNSGKIQSFLCFVDGYRIYIIYKDVFLWQGKLTPKTSSASCFRTSNR